MKRKPIIVAIVLMAGVVAYVNAQEPAILKTAPVCAVERASVDRPLMSNIAEKSKVVKTALEKQKHKAKEKVVKTRGIVKRILSRVFRGRS